jgi:hypothetical protein
MSATGQGVAGVIGERLAAGLISFSTIAKRYEFSWNCQQKICRFRNGQ